MKFPDIRRFLPSWKNTSFAVLAAILLILAFPDFEFAKLAWIALVPLLWAIDREKESAFKSFVLGWIFGIIFFFGTCWWLTFAPITYAGFPALLAYFLLFCITAVAGLFPASFGAILSVSLKRFGSLGMLAAPFIWVATEFARYWITGNNWNAIAYSQAFSGFGVSVAEFGGVLLVSGSIVLFQAFLTLLIVTIITRNLKSFLLQREKLDLFNRRRVERNGTLLLTIGLVTLGILGLLLLLGFAEAASYYRSDGVRVETHFSDVVVAIQPNVPMDGLNEARWRQLRLEHTVLAERGLQQTQQLTTDNRHPTTVIFPESPMNFMFNDDSEFQAFIHAFAAKNNVNVLFNSAEPDAANKKYFNSAVMVDPQGREVAQYDKIYLLPFGESVPFPLQNVVPALVGSFSYGHNYNLFPLGDAKAGVMICFESHFPDLSREYVRRGADAIIEMTNDGYLGPTPVLRQHLANAVFRAVETNRPVLRVTNVGITTYINERGALIDPAASYTEDTRVWTVGKSDGSQTFYVKYGDWFAWFSVTLTAIFLAAALWTKKGNFRNN